MSGMSDMLRRTIGEHEHQATIIGLAHIDVLQLATRSFAIALAEVDVRCCESQSPCVRSQFECGLRERQLVRALATGDDEITHEQRLVRRCAVDAFHREIAPLLRDFEIASGILKARKKRGRQRGV